MKNRGFHLFIALFCSLMVWAVPDNVKLTGTVIGSMGYDYQTGAASMDVLKNAFDGNLATAYASNERSKTWVGLDLGTPHVITSVGWSPRNDGLGPNRMKLAIFEGANREDFMDAVPLYIVDHAGTIGVIEHADVNVSRGFRYVRYVGPHDARCNVAEVEFYGHEGEGDDTQFYQLTNLPTVSIHTVDNEDPLDKVTEHESFVNIIYDNGTRIQSQSATARCRGNASFNFEKKPYRIKFTEKIKPLKGTVDAAPAKAKKWTLINNWGDKTLMRNIVAFEVSRRVGMFYTPYCKPVDVILNGEYKGCYQLSDQITVDKDRVAITEMDPTDNEGENLTGGYLIEIDGYANQEKSWFTSRRGIPVTIKSPDEDDITPQQHNYIEGFFNEMESRLHSAGYRDPETGYRAMLDAESFVTYFLQEQLVANPDVFWSTYMYKDRGDGQLHVGPCWDFDNAFNNDKRSYDMNNKTDFNCGGAANMDGFVRRLLSDPYIARMLQKRWTYYRDSANINLESILAYVDSTEQLLNQSQRLNFMRWDILGKQVHENPIEGVTGEYGSTVEFLRTFLRGRFPWMDRMLSYGNYEEDTVRISTAKELADFADRVNNGSAWVNAVLTADIDYTGYNKMIGDGTNFRGCFDGQGHTIKINIRRSAENAGLFGFMYGEVKNLHVTGNITTSQKYAGGIAAQSAGLFNNCISTVNIQSSVNGDGTHGGIMGISNGAAIDNCVFAGSIKGLSTTCCGGFVGWASAEVNITNSLMIGTFTVSTSGSNLFSRNDVNVHVENSYYSTTWSAAYNAGSTKVNDTQLKSGEVCYRLNRAVSDGSQAWYQTLDKDPYPVPDKSHLPVLYDEKGKTYHNPMILFELIDGNTYTMEQETLVDKFVYTRNFRTKLEPLYLPTKVDASYLQELGLTVYQLNGIRSFDRNADGINEISYLEVEPVTTGSLNVNTPYIVKASTDGYRNVTIKDATLSPSVPVTTTLNGEHLNVDFVGTYNRIMASSLRDMGAYLVGAEALEPAASTILHVCRWYALLHMTDGSDQPAELPIVVKGNEEVLGVLQIHADEHGQLRYDLSGRRVSASQKGIQVMNGKKILND